MNKQENILTEENRTEPKRLAYESPVLKSFSYGDIAIVEGSSGRGDNCPPLNPAIGDDYGVD